MVSWFTIITLSLLAAFSLATFVTASTQPFFRRLKKSFNGKPLISTTTLQPHRETATELRQSVYSRNIDTSAKSGLQFQASTPQCMLTYEFNATLSTQCNGEILFGFAVPLNVCVSECNPDCASTIATINPTNNNIVTISKWDSYSTSPAVSCVGLPTSTRQVFIGCNGSSISSLLDSCNLNNIAWPGDGVTATYDAAFLSFVNPLSLLFYYYFESINWIDFMIHQQVAPVRRRPG